MTNNEKIVPLTDEEIEEHFLKNDLETLLSKYQDCFQSINYYEECLRNHVFDNLVSVRDALQEIGGLYIAMQKPFTIAETVVKNGKDKIFYELKEKAEKNNERIVSTPLEREASFRVAEIRRVRNRFRSKVAICEKCIGIFQSLQNSIRKEEFIPQKG
jgi:hypothetical protein